MPAHSLNQGWRMQTSAAAGQDGAQLSSAALDARAWIPTDLPATVLGAIVESGAMGDPMTGMRLRELPGQGPAAENFSNFPMPEDSPYRDSWWYRTTFELADDAREFAELQLDGINYRANVWLNGELVADASEVVGSYRVHALNVSGRLHRDQPNVLAIEILPPQPCDLALSWVDWNPHPPDKNMGIWRDAWLRTSGAVAVRDSHVVTEIDDKGRAHVVIGGDLVNLDTVDHNAFVTAVLDGHIVSATIHVPAGKRVRYDMPSLCIDRPRLWWPRQLGFPELYDLRVHASVNEVPSDDEACQVGLRQVTSEITEDGYAQMYVNGRPVLIRGAGWAADLFLRRDPAREHAQIDYVLDMNLNTIRFEGMLERNDILERCDREGLMVIAGWCCCDCWERWDDWTAESGMVAVESLRSQIRRVRRHPSMITWWYGSDFPPPAHVEQAYLDVLREERWPNPSHSSAANKPTEITGPSGMKMEGPYDYVPPNYWYEDTVRGGAFGFATEVCPGPAIPPIESLRRMLTSEHLWPIDDVWNFHAGGKEFHNVKAFVDAVTGRFGEVTSAEELAKLSQLMTFEAQRAMFEAYARNKGRATGVVQWMLNNAWPSLIWHLFDYYLRPGGGYFGTRVACRPLHVMYAYDDRSVVVVNETRRAHRDLRVRVRTSSPDGSLVFDETRTLDICGGANAQVLEVPTLPNAALQFVDLRMIDVSGTEIDRNFYWVPQELDELDFEAASWINTPIKRYADLRALRTLPTASLAATAERNRDRVRARVRNAGSALAFFVQLRLADDKGADVLPVRWSDNYVTLQPGEEIAIDAVAAENVPARIAISGMNVPAFAIPIVPRPRPATAWDDSTAREVVQAVMARAR